MNKKFFLGLIFLCVGILLIIYGVFINNNMVFEEDIFVFKEHQIKVVLNEKRALLLYNVDDNSNIKFASTDESVVKIDENGIITAIGEGLALITAESENTSDSATCIIVVHKEDLIKEITNLSLNMNSIDLNIGNSTKLIPVIEPNNALNKELIWSTSNPNIATVDQTGRVVAISNGVVDITVKSKNNKIATCKINIKKEEEINENDKIVNVSSIELNKTSLNLELSNSYSLSYIIKPSNATDKTIFWSSTNPDIALVNEKGQVTALKEGTTTIIVTTKDGGKVAKCDVIVKYSPISVTGVNLNTNSISLNINETYTLKATVSPNNADNKNIVWTSSNNNVATVNNNGLVTGIKEGNATINATTKDGGKVVKCSITVKYVPNVVTGVNLSSNNISLNINETYNLKATVSPNNASNKNVIWTSSDPNIATVSSSGLVTGIKTGITTIKVTTIDGAKVAVCTVKVGTRLIFIGDSRVNRLAGNDGKYSINYRGRDKVFIEKGGTTYADWFSSNSTLMNKVDVVVSKLNGIRCAVIVGLAGNDLNHTTASSVSAGRQKIIGLTEKYNNSLVSLAHKYNNLCTIYFTSVNPVQLNKHFTVYSYDSNNALTKEGRSNSKIETFNNSLKNLILQDNIANLKYIDTSSYFVEYKDKLKNGYNTSDGTHYTEKTTQLVYDKILELTGL